jgi:hypothetical protein
MDIAPIANRFPSFKEKIDWLITSDEEFMEICGDYLLCYYEIVKLNQMYDQPLVRINEYHELLESLEQEILNHLVRSYS